MIRPRSPCDGVRVTAVRHVRDHVLWLPFSNGIADELDLADRLVGPMFEPLREPKEFARVSLGAETIEWPDGAADWAPESLLGADYGVLNQLNSGRNDIFRPASSP